MSKLKTYGVVDFVERVGATFVQAFLAVVAVDGGTITDVTALKTGAVAGALAIAKYLAIRANEFLTTQQG